MISDALVQYIERAFSLFSCWNCAGSAGLTLRARKCLSMASSTWPLRDSAACDQVSVNELRPDGTAAMRCSLFAEPLTLFSLAREWEK
jgi:hypothetical protein